MKRRVPVWTGAVLVLLVSGCGGDSTGPSTGSLAVTVAGLPAGASADVSIGGPAGFTRTLSATQTLSGLVPGSYTVSADPVTAGSVVYAGTPGAQTVTVAEGSTPAQAQVVYAVSSGNLTVTVAGLPGGAAAAVSVTGPDGFDETITATGTFASLTPGSYTVTAEPVSSGGSQYSPSPATQQVTVGTGGTAGATVTYYEDGVAGLNYRIDGVYLTQSVQTYTGTVPLIANRDAYLRVFVTASETGAASPDVRVRFYHAGTQVQEQTIVRGGLTPLAPQEGILSSSWNLPVPGTLIQSGLSLRIDVDPANLIPETNESDNAFPASGVPLSPEVRTAGAFHVTLVPVLTSVDNRLGNVTNANKDQFLAGAMKMHPLSTYDGVVGATMTTSGPALQSGSSASWTTILGELETRRTADGSSRYYLGIVNPAYSSGVAGIGYIGYPVALAWDKLPSASSVAAHEWGHNWGRSHAPCGNPGGEDVQYPYNEGIIGVYGFDVATATLKPTSSHDLMGYCNDEWISDYTYRGVMNFRGAEAGVASSLGQAVQPTLVIWGRIEEDRVVLEPAFQAVTRPSLPTSDGPYQVEARAADGSRVFALRFAPREIADLSGGARPFAFAIPLSDQRAARIASLLLEGNGLTAAVVSSDIERSGPVTVRRVGPDRVALAWDASRAPMVVVRDPATGQVLSFARGGRAEIATAATELALSLSDRLRSRDERVRVESR